MDLNIEVIISKLADQYVAKTPNFPKCIGKSDILEVALEKLALSISKKIYDNTKKKLVSLLTSKDYKEVITASEQKESNIHRIYNLNFYSNQKSILINYRKNKNNTLDKILTDNNLQQNENENINAENDFASLFNKKNNNEENNQLFLYPISLN